MTWELLGDYWQVTLHSLPKKKRYQASGLPMKSLKDQTKLGWGKQNLRATCHRNKLKLFFLSLKTETKNKVAIKPLNYVKVRKLKSESNDMITGDCTLMPVAQSFNNTWHISWYPEISVSKILRKSYMKGKSMDVNFK